MLELVSKIQYAMFIKAFIKKNKSSTLDKTIRKRLQMALKLGVSEHSKKFAESITPDVEVPSVARVIDYSQGILNEGQENQRSWANLTAVDLKLYKKFESIGQTDFCPSFKIKLRNYQDENLDGLINAEIVVNKYELSFVLDKLKQPVGLALVAELADISLK